MSGEFYFICEGCGEKLTVTAIPRCPTCNLSAMRCDGCMEKHDCAAAKKEKAWWDRHPD